MKEDIKVLEKWQTIKILYSDTFCIYIEQLEQLQLAIENILKEREQDKARISELEECLKYSNKYVNELQEENTDYRYKINMLKDDLKETIKEEREFMKDLEHKNVAFHYANGRETLAKGILNILEE